jgi:hypothetical protein
MKGSMGTTFWIRRYLLVLVLGFVVFAGAHLLRGRPFESSIIEALIWSVIFASIFVGVRLYQSRKGVHCAICNDIPVDAEPNRDRAV